MVSPTQQRTRIQEWMENHLPADNSIDFQDVTSLYTVISVVGPKSKDLMQVRRVFIWRKKNQLKKLSR